MKLILPTLLFSAFIIASCAQTKPILDEFQEANPDMEELGMRGGEVAIKLYSKDKSDTVESSIEYMFYDNAVLPYQDSVNRIIKEYVSGTVSNGGGMTEQNSELSVEFMEESIDKFADEYNRQLELIDGGGVWQTETSISIIEENSDYVEVSFQNWNYSGGAHGNAWSEQRIIEKPSGRELRLEDFFMNIEELTAIAEVIFRADQELEEGTSLVDAGFWFDDGFKLNENFVIGDEVVGFLYNQYEIAPYSAGMIVLEIPMSKIKHLLKRK